MDNTSCFSLEVDARRLPNPEMIHTDSKFSTEHILLMPDERRRCISLQNPRSSNAMHMKHSDGSFHRIFHLCVPDMPLLFLLVLNEIGISFLHDMPRAARHMCMDGLPCIIHATPIQPVLLVLPSEPQHGTAARRKKRKLVVPLRSFVGSVLVGGAEARGRGGPANRIAVRFATVQRHHAPGDVVAQEAGGGLRSGRICTPCGRSMRGEDVHALEAAVRPVSQ